MCPHFFGHIWSSRKQPAAPASINSPTVRTTFSALPYPVSASTMIGIATARQMRRARSMISVWVSNPMSGSPINVADTA